MSASKKINYDLLDSDWRAGLKSPRQMAAEYGAATGTTVSHTAITKYFTKQDIPRDLKARIKARAEALVAAAEVDTKVYNETKITDDVVVEEQASKAANALLGHRSDVKRYNTLAQSLLSELEASTDNKDLFDQLGELLRSENDKGVDKLNDIYQKVIGMPGRVDSLKKLSEVLKTLIGLERQALGMSDNANGEADAPKAVPQLSDHEAARRVAFLLQKGIRGTP